jgi:hypothetical protein
MKNYDGQSLSDQTIEGDGCSFIGSTLTRCRLIYRGGNLPVLAKAKMIDTEIEFRDCALNALAFLSYVERANPHLAKRVLDKARDTLMQTARTLPQH